MKIIDFDVFASTDTNVQAMFPKDDDVKEFLLREFNDAILSEKRCGVRIMTDDSRWACGIQPVPNSKFVSLVMKHTVQNIVIQALIEREQEQDTYDKVVPTPERITDEETTAILNKLEEINPNKEYLFFVNGKGYVLGDYVKNELGTYAKVTPLHMTEPLELGSLKKRPKLALKISEAGEECEGVTDEVLDQCIDLITPAEILVLSSLKEGEALVNTQRAMIYVKTIDNENTPKDCLEFNMFSIAEGLRIYINPNENEQ